MRRVITGVGPDGASVVVSDEELPVVAPGTIGVSVSILGGADDLPFELPHSGVFEHRPTFMPGPGGLRIQRVSVEPGEMSGRGSPLADGGDAPAEAEISDEGYHQTATVDILFVIKGRIGMLLDDEEVEVGEGDCLIQFGPMHAWRNRGEEVAEVGLVILGAR